ncbi:hypothetical protein MtrunA17_Chr7g0216851 [Medicago truncatula]|uniref:Uncharacterized protein n=1 Tax=Medicago truncatula TaxID=3880 RepID=A0A396GSU3_MEDTR|nr:hypothetical protein MtrunA17_Chr7g0216851 [Medicago truncatula]
MASASTTLTLNQCQWLSSSTSSMRLPSSRVTCKASESHPQLSVSTTVDKTLCQINNSGVIACLRANRSHLPLSSLLSFSFLFLIFMNLF